MNQDNKNSYYDHLVTLLKEVSHELRSPLSIISSDISYWEALNGHQAYELSKTAVERSVMVLDQLTILTAGTELQSHLSISQLEAALSSPLTVNSPTFNYHQHIAIKNSSLTLALNQILEIFQPLSFRADQPNQDSIAISLTITDDVVKNEGENNSLSSRIFLNQTQARLKLLLAQVTLEALGASCSLQNSELTICLPLWEKAPQF